MKIFKNIKFLLLILVLGFSCLQIKNFCYNINSKKIVILNDQIFSTNLITLIENFIKDNLPKKLPEKFYKLLKENFPAVDSVNISRKKCEHIITEIKSDLPIYRINNDLVFTKNSKFLSQDFFNENFVQDLSQILINGEYNNEVKQFLNQLTDNITENYKINWKNKNNIELEDKNKDLTLIVDYEKLPIQKILDACHKIKKEIIESQAKKNKLHVIADLRFTNQIIISIEKGG